MTRNPLPHGQPQVIPIKRTFAIIGAIVIAEPFAATILFPFVYFMIHDFGTVQEKDITFRAGLLSELPGFNSRKSVENIQHLC